MGQNLSTIVIITIWIISFIEPSGWAVNFHLPEKINYAILSLSIILFIFSPGKRQNISVSVFILLIISFIIIPFVVNDSWQGAEYLVAFLVVYIMSQGTITPKVIRYSGLIVAGLGLCLLIVYSRGSFLSGWNDNAVSMMGLFSFLFFSIFLIEKKKTKQFWFWNIISFLYASFLFGTDCRSGMLFLIISILGILYSNKVKSLLKKKATVLLLLNTPLLLAFMVIWLSESDYYYALNSWSINEFDKSIFNGRDLLWEYSLNLLNKSYYIGTGKFLINYHNSGVATLSVFGILGYLCWINYFNTNLKQLKRYLKDDIVFASLFAFCLIFLQQSVDLGFISPTPNFLPYMILGVGLGRIRLLRRNRILSK